jgi:hypothetical protein
MLKIMTQFIYSPAFRHKETLFGTLILPRLKNITNMFLRNKI